jgi:hypothetical protein
MPKIKKTQPPLIVGKRLRNLLKCRVKKLMLLRMPKPPMRATSCYPAPVRLKTVALANEVIGSVCRSKTMARDWVTAWKNLFALGFREQVWA